MVTAARRWSMSCALTAHMVQPLGDIDAARGHGCPRDRPFKVGLHGLRVEAIGANPKREACERDLCNRIELRHPDRANLDRFVEQPGYQDREENHDVPR